MKLYRVTLTYEVVGLANDEEEAEIEAEGWLRDEMTGPFTVDVLEVKDELDLPSNEWAYGLAHNDPTETRIRDIINRGHAEESE